MLTCSTLFMWPDGEELDDEGLEDSTVIDVDVALSLVTKTITSLS